VGATQILVTVAALLTPHHHQKRFKLARLQKISIPSGTVQNQKKTKTLTQSTVHAGPSMPLLDGPPRPPWIVCGAARRWKLGARHEKGVRPLPLPGRGAHGGNHLFRVPPHH